MPRYIQGVGRARVRSHRHIGGPAGDRQEDDQRRGDIARGPVHRAPDDQLETDHDEDQRPEIADLIEALDRDLSCVDEEGDDAGQDEDGGPQEGSVAVGVAHYRELTFTRRAPPWTVTS